MIMEARNQLEALEAACANTQLDPQASAPVLSAFSDNVTTLATRASQLRSMLLGEPPSRRQVWKARLRDLDDQIAELRGGHARCAARLRHIRSERSVRDELFQRRAGALPQAQMQRGDAVLRVGVVEEARALDESSGTASAILNSGRGALEKLVFQKGRLRSVRKKMLDVMNNIGVDRRIIASIERREYSDTLLVYGLMAGMLLLLGLAVLWKYHRKRDAG